MNEPSRTPAEAALQRSRNLPIALLFLGTIINYVDRQVLSLLKPSIEAAYGWGDAEFAHFASMLQLELRWGVTVMLWMVLLWQIV